MDGLREAIEILQAEAAGYSPGVQIWMRVMAISFFAGIVFTPWKTGARWIVGVMVVTAVGLVVGKMLVPELSREAIGAALHLSLWSIVLVILWRAPARRARDVIVMSWFERTYRVWLVWVSGLMAVSLAFDARAVLAIIF